MSIRGYEKKLFDSRSEANDVLDKLKEMADMYGAVSLKDYNELIGLKSSFEDSNVGWSRSYLLKSEVLRQAGYYYIYLPMPLSLYSDWESGDENWKDETEPDMVNHPSHYISENGIEVIDVIEAFTKNLTGIEATDTGNIIKYACRWKDKNGVEDLKKLRWYTDHLINHIENL